jgi:hypothetical protein
MANCVSYLPPIFLLSAFVFKISNVFIYLRKYYSCHCWIASQNSRKKKFNHGSKKSKKLIFFVFFQVTSLSSL